MRIAEGSQRTFTASCIDVAPQLSRRTDAQIKPSDQGPFAPVSPPHTINSPIPPALKTCPPFASSGRTPAPAT
jgi:hypothetical protein